MQTILRLALVGVYAVVVPSALAAPSARVAANACKGNASSEPIQGAWVSNVSSSLLNSPAQIKEGLDLARRSHLNTIFPAVWNKESRMYLQRDFEAGSPFNNLPLMPDDPTHDPYNPPDAQRAPRDVLQDVINEAHRPGAQPLQVMPWFEYGMRLTDMNNVIEKDPAKKDWLSQGQNHQKIWCSETPGANCKDLRSYQFLNPFNPEVQGALTRLVLEVVHNYKPQAGKPGIDGLQFDDNFGLPASFGYDDYTREMYKNDPRGGNGQYPPSNPLDPKWSAWRTQKITDFMGRLSDAVKRECASCKIVMSSHPIAYAKQHYLQDIDAWAHSGKIDADIVQLYGRGTAAAMNRELTNPALVSVANCIPTSVGLEISPTATNRAGAEHFVQTQIDALTSSAPKGGAPVKSVTWFSLQDIDRPGPQMDPWFQRLNAQVQNFDHGVSAPVTPALTAATQVSAIVKPDGAHGDNADSALSALAPANPAQKIAAQTPPVAEAPPPRSLTTIHDQPLSAEPPSLTTPHGAIAVDDHADSEPKAIEDKPIHGPIFEAVAKKAVPADIGAEMRGKIMAQTLTGHNSHGACTVVISHEGPWFFNDKEALFRVLAYDNDAINKKGEITKDDFAEVSFGQPDVPSTSPLKTSGTIHEVRGVQLPPPSVTKLGDASSSGLNLQIDESFYQFDDEAHAHRRLSRGRIVRPVRGDEKVALAKKQTKLSGSFDKDGCLNDLSINVSVNGQPREKSISCHGPFKIPSGQSCLKPKKLLEKEVSSPDAH